MRLAFARVEGIVCVSKGAADDLSRITGVSRNRINAIYNPIVGGAKVPAKDLPAKYAATVGYPRILAVGTLKTIKDYPTLLKAFALLLRAMPDARLLVLGEGDERTPLEALVQELGIAGNVSLPGFVDNTEAYYDKADLFVLTSVGEGFGNVIVEALEHGVPVVSTDCPSGPREILAGGRYGTLVPVSDPEALAEAMHDALTRTHDKAALKARAADFSVSKAADAYLDLLLPDWRKQMSQSGTIG